MSEGFAAPTLEMQLLELQARVTELSDNRQNLSAIAEWCAGAYATTEASATEASATKAVTAAKTASGSCPASRSRRRPSASGHSGSSDNRCPSTFSVRSARGGAPESAARGHQHGCPASRAGSSRPGQLRRSRTNAHGSCGAPSGRAPCCCSCCTGGAR